MSRALTSEANPARSRHEQCQLLFWTENPNVLLDPKYLFEVCPVPSQMTFEQELNALTRLVVLFSLLVLVRSGPDLKTVLICALTLAAIALFYRYDVFHRASPGCASTRRQEGYSNPAANPAAPHYDNRAHDAAAAATLTATTTTMPALFDRSTSTNPFANVLVTDYQDNPGKKPAEPSHGDDFGQDPRDGRVVVVRHDDDFILQNTKDMIQDCHPGQPDLAEKLFTDMGDQYVFEQSLRPFHSNPSTTIPNDQRGFAEFCYGSMISCKEGNLFACARNLPSARL